MGAAALRRARAFRLAGALFVAGHSHPRSQGAHLLRRGAQPLIGQRRQSRGVGFPFRYGGSESAPRGGSTGAGAASPFARAAAPIRREAQYQLLRHQPFDTRSPSAKSFFRPRRPAVGFSLSQAKRAGHLWSPHAVSGAQASRAPTLPIPASELAPLELILAFPESGFSWAAPRAREIVIPGRVTGYRRSHAGRPSTPNYSLKSAHAPLREFSMKFRGTPALGNRRHKAIVCPTAGGQAKAYPTSD